MGAYNFKRQFKADIDADRKRHTIRAKRRYPDKPGDILALYVGMRTKQCRLLKRRMCTRVQDIGIRVLGTGTRKAPYELQITIDGERVTDAELNRFAQSDGFESFIGMIKFWVEHYKADETPFSGDLIHWESDADFARRTIDAEFISRRKPANVVKRKR